MTFTKNFPIRFDPEPNPEAVINVPKARFTLLTERLLRLEFAPNDLFEDRPSQLVWYRKQPVPEFSVVHKTDELRISTPYLELKYKISKTGFSHETLQIKLNELGGTWHMGQTSHENLLGTARTLDESRGPVDLAQGLLSREGWAVVDDSASLVFNPQGWVEPRKAADGYLDLYFLGHGLDFQAALDDYSKITGSAPLIPRWMLGNWWSRYWAYTSEELLSLMHEFQDHNVPLSVCIVDMDWHITDTGNKSNGWTGYTWNKELFPSPKKFLNELHNMGLKVALNLHPAKGVYPHEAGYKAVARHLGLDEEQEKPIEFDIASPEFSEAYFQILHHPLEEQGVDFWWLDWQQGEDSNLKGLDPLWWLNHLHYYDLGRDNLKRPVIFSRWGGLGNHRYPIGFSGDTQVSWDALAYQPYFTATAANVNYGWWSHDIGGHMGGIEDRELYTRWVQFGVFSPIFRLHSTKNKFHERRPWGYDPEVEQITSHFMRLRHKLIPYLYSMAYKNHRNNSPLVRGMYHEYSEREEAYHCPDQYLFGSELLVAPFLTPLDNTTGLSRTAAWLPETTWFDFFSGIPFPGDHWYSLYGGLDEIPVFAQAGAIIPLVASNTFGDADLPESLEIQLFPQGDNRFLLYEDDGGTRTIQTEIIQYFNDEEWRVILAPPEGDLALLPDVRTLTYKFRGVASNVSCLIEKNGAVIQPPIDLEQNTSAVSVGPVEVSPNDRIEIKLTPIHGGWVFPGDWRRSIFDKLTNASKIDSWVKQKLERQYEQIKTTPSLIEEHLPVLSASQQQAFLELFTGVGLHKLENRDGRGQGLILWNNFGFEEAVFRFSTLDRQQQPFTIHEHVPAFGYFSIDNEKISFQAGSEARRFFGSIKAWFDCLTQSLEEICFDRQGKIQFDFLDGLPDSFYLEIQDGKGTINKGKTSTPDAEICAYEEDWLALVNGWKSIKNLMEQKKIKVSGDFELALQLSQCKPGVILNSFLPDEWQIGLTYYGGLTTTRYRGF